MKQEFRFYVNVHENGQQIVQCQSNIPNTSNIRMILGQFGHSINEMKWFKEEFYKELDKGSSTSWGHNILAMNIDKEFCEIYYKGEPENSQTISTELVKRYIERAITFLEKYHANKIPGLETKLRT